MPPMSLVTQVVLDLNVDASVREDQLLPLLPLNRRDVKFLHLSELVIPSGPRLGPDRAPVDWQGLGNGVVKMAREALSLREASPNGVEFFITGSAPLPLFTLL